MIRDCHAGGTHTDWMGHAVTLVQSRNIRIAANYFPWGHEGDARYSFWDLREGVDRTTLVVECNADLGPP